MNFMYVLLHQTLCEFSHRIIKIKVDIYLPYLLHYIYNETCISKFRNSSLFTYDYIFRYFLLFYPEYEHISGIQHKVLRYVYTWKWIKHINCFALIQINIFLSVPILIFIYFTCKKKVYNICHFMLSSNHSMSHWQSSFLKLKNITSFTHISFLSLCLLKLS